MVIIFEFFGDRLKASYDFIIAEKTYLIKLKLDYHVDHSGSLLLYFNFI